MKTNLVATLAGLVFALGLGISGMTQPSKVIGFLDVAGDWDPSLIFVMLGAIAVHMPFALRARRLAAPRFAASFALPTAHAIDRRLLLGAALFGLGWGTAGFCPGPALVSLATLSPTVLAFVASMLAGMTMYSLIFERTTSARDRTPMRRAA